MEHLPFQKNIPVIKKVDVLVAGGGPAGLAAAIASARNGRETLLVEQLNCLGGMATGGLVGPFMSTAGENGGIYRELLDRLEKNKGAEGRAFDVECLKYFAQIMCEEAGVKLLLHSFICDVTREKSEVRAVIVANKSGLQALSAEVIIDATGDGDVAFFAGAEYEKGDREGRCQPTTMMFHIRGFDESRIPSAEEIEKKVKLARSRGEITLPGYVNYIWGDKGSTIRRGEVSINLDMTEGLDGTDPEALTRAEVEGRKSVWECLRFIRQYIPGAENAYISKTPFLHGIRETRRISGEYVLSEEDVLKARKFKDGIAKGSFFIDIHGPYLQDKDWVKSRYVPEGDWYEIPYRCLLVRNIDNLLVAGRCISSDREANGSLRIQPTCMATGQAAGTAAAIAVKEKIRPREVEGKNLRKILISQGADL